MLLQSTDSKYGQIAVKYSVLRLPVAHRIEGDLGVLA